jgi:hypothetical protein
MTSIAKNVPRGIPHQDAIEGRFTRSTLETAFRRMERAMSPGFTRCVSR